MSNLLSLKNHSSLMKVHNELCVLVQWGGMIFIELSKTSDWLDKIIFWYIFDSFSLIFPFFMPKSKLLPSSLSWSFLKSVRSESLSLLFTKEQPWGFTPANLYKRGTGAICSFSLANFSFAHKKQGICFAKTQKRIPNPAKNCNLKCSFCRFVF